MSKSGIYRIENTENGKIYIGGTFDITNRWSSHRYDLKHNTHTNHKLQKDWNFYGEDCFELKIFRELEPPNLEKRIPNIEQKYIEVYKPEYNIKLKTDKNLPRCNQGKNNFWWGKDRKGEKATNKLTADDVKDIKKKLKEGKLSHREIANQYGVVRTTISNISQGLNWSHIEID